ncbi:MAG: PAS domain S-box protein [Paludibacter sp.]|nr:PAS domain S-box protein [Paludibacter sp.]
MQLSSEIYNPLKNTENLKVTDIFEIAYIQKLQDLFSEATGVSSIITYPDGIPITKPSNFCRLCNDIIRKTDVGHLNCRKSDAIIGRLNSHGPIVQPCLSGGLWDAGASIKVGDTHIANWLIGQVRNNKVDLNELKKHANEIGVDENEYIKAWEDVPIMTEQQFKKIAEMLFVFANELSEKAYLNLQLKKEIYDRKKIDKTYQENQELLSITLNSIGDAVISTDINGHIVEMNPVAQELCGWTLQDAKGRPLDEVLIIVNSTTRKNVENPVKNVLQSGKILGFANHTILLSKNGNEYRISDSAAPIKNRDGIIIGVVLVFSDVTEKYNSEKALKESERSKSVLLSNLPGMAYRCKFDRNWTMEFVSEGCFELIGYQCTDLTTNNKLSFNDLILPEFREYLWNVWNDAVKFNKTVTVEYKIKTVDNVEKWVWEQGIPIYNKKGEAIALEGYILDITEKKKIEADLIERDHFLDQIQLIVQLGTYSFDLKSNEWSSSAILDDIFGIELNFEKTFDSWISIIHPEWQEIMYDYVLNTVIGEKKSFDKKYKIIRKNDFTERWVYGKGELILNNEGNPIALIGSIQDITESEEIEITLQKSEEKYRNIFENVQDVFFQIDSAGIIIEMSPSIKFYSDFEREEMIGRPVIELYNNPNDRDIFLKNLSVSGELRDYEINLKTKSGILKSGSLNAKLTLDNNGNILQINGSVRDITKRKLAEEALRESEKKFHDYIKFAPHGVLVANENGKYIEVNNAASLITGYSETELIEMDQRDLIDIESLEKFENHFKKAINNGYATDELTLTNKDTTKKFVAVDTVKISEKRYIGFIVDITNKKIIEKNLKSRESYLRETQLIAQLGTYTINFETNQWNCSKILGEIFGLTENYDYKVEDLIKILHPDWRKDIYDYFIANALENKSKFDKKFKIIRPVDQEERWVHALGEVIYNRYGKPKKMIGTIQDITHRKNLAEALRKSEALYKSILNASPDAIIVVDIDGTIKMISPATLILYGVADKSQLLGQNMFDFLTPDDKERAKLNVKKMFEEYLGTVEYQIRKLNGVYFYAEVNGDIIWDVYGQPTGILFIVRDISERKKTELNLVESEDQLKKFASHLQTVREEERIMLASEIHDELGQILIALKIDLGLLKQKVLKSSKNKAIEDILTKFDNVFKLVDNTINTTRKIMTDLRPEVLYMLGFIEGVKFYIKKFEQRYKIICLFNSQLTELNLNPEQSIALFRVLQEALTNVIQHSEATEVNVKLNIISDQLIFEIADNGVGIKNNMPLKKDSYGIIGMRERVLLFNGELLIIGKPGKGTKIKVIMPYKQ